MPAKVKSPGAMAAIMGMTIATCPCDMPVSTPMMNDTAATITGCGSGDDVKNFIIFNVTVENHCDDGYFLLVQQYVPVGILFIAKR